jgi:hypothetical protein
MPKYLVTKNRIAKSAAIDATDRDFVIVDSVQRIVRAPSPKTAMDKSFSIEYDGTVWRPIRAEKIND